MLPAEYAPALRESWAFFVHLAIVLIPLFIGGSFLVGLAEEYLPPARVERALRGHDEGTGNIAAAGFGAITPFCSCSTVPVLAGLLQAGAPLGLAFSFLLASPLVNEIAVILLIGVFGLKVTAWYILMTFTAAVVGGIIIGRLGLENEVKDIQLSASSGKAAATDGGTASSCGTCQTPTGKSHRERFSSAAQGAWGFFTDSLPYLLVGMVAGALIHGVVPIEVVQAIIGPGNPIAVPLAAVAGAPIYISMSGMLPIAASLNSQGIPIGTVLAFVIGGAGVSIPNLILLKKLFKRKLLLAYTITVVFIGTGIGVLFNSLFV